MGLLTIRVMGNFGHFSSLGPGSFIGMDRAVWFTPAGEAGVLVTEP